MGNRDQKLHTKEQSPLLGQTFVQKAIARAASRESAEVGEIVEVMPDRLLSHDNTAAILDIFHEMGASQVWDPTRLIITLDHAAPAPTIRHALNHEQVRKFVEAQGIQHFFDVGEGICHQLVAEHALLLPGQMLLGADSHTPHQGWMGAFAAGVGRSEMAALWALGRIWLRVPETIRITLKGCLSSQATVKDVALTLIGVLGSDGAIYRSVEFTGDGVHALSIEERMILTNMMAEMGAKSAYIPPDEKTLNWLAPRLARRLGISRQEALTRLETSALFPDPTARYVQEIEIFLPAIRPVIARPHRVDNVAPLHHAAGTRIQQAFIGTCTHGRLSDLEAAAKILEGQKVAPGVRLLIIPASREVYIEALKHGLIDVFLKAGAVIGPPGCGPCMGNHMGVLAPGEVGLMAANRNFRGRMGDKESQIYLASPEVVAQGAIEGKIPDMGAINANSENRSAWNVGVALCNSQPALSGQGTERRALSPNGQQVNSQIQLTGRVWKYGDHVNTDVIFPGRYTYTVHSAAEMAKHALEDLDPKFATHVQPGDIIVAGWNWGNGSSREQAVVALKAAGVSALIVKSCARIYYRNAFNNGLPVIIAPDAVDAIEPGERVTVDMQNGTISTHRGTFHFSPPPDILLGITSIGGLKEYVRRQLQTADEG